MKIMKNQKSMGNKGFSLVELIVVIAIMAVLVGVLAPQFIKYVEKSKESTDIQNLDSLVTVVQTYFADRDMTKDVVISVSGGVFKATSDDSGTQTAAENALSEANASDTKVKSEKWDSNFKATISSTSGVASYEGSADHYKANDDNDGYEVK
jgi:type IV pilus assembly protein PilA